MNIYLYLMELVYLGMPPDHRLRQYIALKNKIQMDMKIFFVFNYMYFKI